MSIYRQCWIDSTTARSTSGYVKAGSAVEGTREGHRISFFLHYGYWPDVCRHTCDTPPCYNPTHLIDGTQLDNIEDMTRRGRRFKLNKNMPASGTKEYAAERWRRMRDGKWISR